ncbi:hypothetical protein CR513_62818, partial [Mucuna pruriens]
MSVRGLKEAPLTHLEDQEYLLCWYLRSQPYVDARRRAKGIYETTDLQSSMVGEAVLPTATSGRVVSSSKEGAVLPLDINGHDWQSGPRKGKMRLTVKVDQEIRTDITTTKAEELVLEKLVALTKGF